MTELRELTKLLEEVSDETIDRFFDRLDDKQIDKCYSKISKIQGSSDSLVHAAELVIKSVEEMSKYLLDELRQSQNDNAYSTM